MFRRYNKLITINSSATNQQHNNNYYYYNGYSSIIMFLLFNLYALSWSEAIPEDSNFSSHPSNFNDNSDDGLFISAFLNVTFKTDHGWKWDKTEVGRYGGTFIGSSYGILVHVSSLSHLDDHSGCTYPLVNSMNGEISSKPWIALIKRGHCNFDTKVDNAFLSKASGVLIYNDRDSSSLDKMQLSSDSRRNISAVFIYKWKGEELVKLLSTGSNVYVHISVAGHTSSKAANINRTSVLFVSITFIVLMIISLTWLLFYYVRRFQYMRSKDRLNRKLGNAAKKALSKIPTKNIKSGDKQLKGDGECCAICIELYKSGDTVRMLPCLHEFHKPCIDPWLLEHRTCPMCKMDILKHYGFVCIGSHESILHFGLSDDHSSENPHAPLSPQRNGLSPLPEIRIITHHVRPAHYDNSVDDDSSRASTPNEMTPSLPLNNDNFTPSNSNNKLIETTAIIPSSQPTSKSKRCLNCGTPCDIEQQDASTSKMLEMDETESGGDSGAKDTDKLN